MNKFRANVLSKLLIFNLSSMNNNLETYTGYFRLFVFIMGDVSNLDVDLLGGQISLLYFYNGVYV